MESKFTPKGILAVLTFTLALLLPNLSFAQPSANFSWVDNGLAIDFFDQSTPNGFPIVSWFWDFGDGNTSTQQNPSHFYAAPGAYVVCLLVQDSATLTDSLCLLVNVQQQGGPGCQAYFAYSLQNCPTAQMFNASTPDSGEVITNYDWYVWETGDTSSQMAPSFTFQWDSTFTVELVITTSSGCMDTITDTIPIYCINTNGAPVANSDYPHPPANSIDFPLDPLVNDADPEMDPLTITNILVAPSNGTATITPAGDNIEYTPNPGFVGYDNIDYQVCDNQGNCAVGYICVIVIPSACDITTDFYAKGWEVPNAFCAPNPPATPCATFDWRYRLSVMNTGTEIMDGYQATIDLDPTYTLLTNTITIGGPDAASFTYVVTPTSIQLIQTAPNTVAPGGSAWLEYDVYINTPPIINGAGYQQDVSWSATCAGGAMKSGYENYHEDSECSCDPNEIHVSPVGCGPDGAIDTSVHWLTYTVNFQNLGLGPARDVIVYDTLDPDLIPLSTMVLGGDPFLPNLSVSGGVVAFSFYDIWLPAAMWDSAGSNGSVSFKIQTASNAPGTEIRNRVGIVFDLNDPVITNEVVNTYSPTPSQDVSLGPDQVVECDTCFTLTANVTGGSPPFTYTWSTGDHSQSIQVCTPSSDTLMSISVTVEDQSGACLAVDQVNLDVQCNMVNLDPELDWERSLALDVFPNPFSQMTTFMMKSSVSREIKLEVFDLSGKRVSRVFEGKLATGISHSIDYDASTLPAGMYFYRLDAGEGRSKSGKLILMK